MVSITQVRSSPLNPRKDFRDEELAELAEVIRTKGLVQPIIVRPSPVAAGEFEIVAGERRWRASLKAGIHTVPVIVRELTDKEMLELAIIENVQRQDLNAIEEASRLSRSGRALRLQSRAAVRDHRQEPQPCRQHDAAC